MPATPFTIIGHRGACGQAPENSLTSFCLAADQGAKWVELDVRALRCGTPVVFHDATLHRTTGQHGLIAVCGRRSLEGIRLADGSRIPELEEVLQAMADRQVGVYIEIKTRNQAAVRAVVAQARACDGSVVVSSFHHRVLRQARSCGWEGPIMALFDQPINQLPGEVVEHGEVGIDVRLSRHPSCLAQIEAGRRLLVFTVNAIPEAADLQRRGFGGVFTDWPGKLLQACGAAVSP